MQARFKNIFINIILVFLSFLFSVYVALFAYIKWASINEKPLIDFIGNNSLVQKIYMRAHYLLLINTVKENSAIPNTNSNEGYFDTVWDFNKGVALSRNIFLQTEMYGFPKYRYHPNIKIYNGRVWDGFAFQPFVTRLTPDIEGLLRQNKTENPIYFYTDENGFKKTEFVPTETTTQVFFLGDSFTEGLWVSAEDTFANQFGKLAAEKGLSVTPYNLGVNGYGALEESWQVEYFAPLLHPKIVVINVYPNDVHPNTVAVIQGRENIPEKNYQEMFYYLDKMRLFCETQHIELVVAVIPLPFQSLQDSAFQERIKSWSRDRHLLFLDPREYFNSLDMSDAYFLWDPHFNSKGHAHYATYLFKNLEPLLKENHQHQQSSANTRQQ